MSSNLGKINVVKRSQSTRNLNRKYKMPKYVKRRNPRNRPISNSSGQTTQGSFQTRIKGSEIVYTTGTVEANKITAIIPSNPRYMPTALRLYNTARTFQQWKPISMSYEWVPTCPTTSTGNAVMGTLWSGGFPHESGMTGIISVLQASNGGVVSAVYTRSHCRPQLTGRMSQNWYYFNNLEEDSNPFNFVFVNNLNNSGYVICHYDIAFNNPTTQMETVTADYSFTGSPFDAADGTAGMLEQSIEVKDYTASGSVSTILAAGVRFVVDTAADGITKILRVYGNQLIAAAIGYSFVRWAKFFRVPFSPY